MFVALPELALPGPAAGLAAADPDGDGQPELIVVPTGGPVRAYRWAGSALRPAAPDGPATGPVGGLAAADLDGDGAEELYLPAPTGPSPRPTDRLLKLLPTGAWIDLFADPLNRPARGPTGGRVAAALDRRGDGRFGFLVGSDGWPLRLIELGRDGRLADLARALAVGHVVAARGVVAMPLAGDATDLFVTTEGGANLYFRNRGDGTFAEAADGGLADAGEHARGAAVVDAGGGAGLCWANWDGPHRLAVREPGGAWRDRASPAFALPSAARGAVVADFDNDGREEVFVLHHGEPNRLFRLAAGAGGAPPTLTRLDPGAAADFDATAAVVMDADRDGVPELLLAGPAGVAAFRARTAGGWLRFVPRTRFGAPARGTAVLATIDGRDALRVIDGGPHEPVAHFGLGGGARVTRVTVTWPDGAALTLGDPDANCTYDMPYPAG
ncbi:MAG TPA: CRTAC1 family protein [Urbifossiella sp.]|nr:CRTAC1 family protein [Urbifossiella sp.]